MELIKAQKELAIRIAAFKQQLIEDGYDPDALLKAWRNGYLAKDWAKWDAEHRAWLSTKGGVSNDSPVTARAKRVFGGPHHEVADHLREGDIAARLGNHAKAFDNYAQAADTLRHASIQSNDIKDLTDAADTAASIHHDSL